MSADLQSFHNPSGTLPDDIWTFETVEQWLIEALLVLHRLPDREAGWRKVQTMSLWRQVQREWGDYVDSDDAPRGPGVTRRELAEMEEALGWLAWVAAGDTRRIVGMGLHQKLINYGAAISWTVMRKRFVARGDKGWTTDGLRKRYGRAIGTICERLNSLSARQIWSDPTGKPAETFVRGRQALESASGEILGVRPKGGLEV